jgi:hypothetical protein
MGSGEMVLTASLPPGSLNIFKGMGEAAGDALAV